MIRIGDVIRVNGEEILIDTLFPGHILGNDKYKASIVLLEAASESGRWGIADELESVAKVGHLKGPTVARLVRGYLEATNV